MKTSKSWVKGVPAIVLVGALSSACSDDDPVGPTVVSTPLEIATSVLPPARVGEAYTAEIIARGGATPYAWSASDLPTGLSLSASGLLSGEPDMSGSFSVRLEVTDDEGQLARRDLMIEVSAPGPMRPVLAGTCTTPTALQLSAGSQTLIATLPAATGTTDFCGGAAQATAYFTLEIAMPAQLRAAVVSEADVSLAPIDATCPAEQTDACGRVYSEALEPGQYRFVLAGPPSADVNVVFELAPIEVPPGPPSCMNPATVNLASGQTILSGNFTDAMDNETGSCSFGALPEIVYVIELDEPSDLVIEASSSLVYLRADDCSTGGELYCDDFNGRPLVNIPAGRYFLFVEPRFERDTQYSVRVVRRPGTPPADNASCATAAPLVFTDGIAEVTADFANVPPNVVTPSTCGDRERGLYYSFELAEPSAVEINAGFSSQVSVELASGTCASRAVLACESFDGVCSPTLDAGSYLLRVSPSFNFTGTVPLSVTLPGPRVVQDNQSCTEAASIVPGTTVNLVTTDATDDGFFGNGCSTTGAGELYYTFELAERSDVTVTLDGTGRFDHSAIVTTSTCASPETLACERGFDPARLFGLAAGRYNVVVERRFNSSTQFSCRDRADGNVDVNLTATASPPAPDNDTCTTTSSTTFPRGVGSIEVVNGTTQGAGSDFGTVFCATPFSRTVAVPGPDVVFPIDIPASGRLRVEMSPADFNYTLSLHSGTCADVNAITCNSSSGRLDTPTAVAPGRYYLRVDSNTQATPLAFSLTLTLLAP